MPPFGLVGPSYTSQSLNADAQTCKNLYCERDESGHGKSPMVLYPTPGTKVFATFNPFDSLTPISVRGQFDFNGRMFAVVGSNFFEVFADGTSQIYPTLLDDSLPASITGGPTQILISSGGAAYVFDLVANTLTMIPSGTLTNVAQVDFLDGFFIATLKNSNTFQVSALEDATTWDPTEVASISIFADNIVSMKVYHRTIWFLLKKGSCVYYDAGDPLFPFSLIPGSDSEQGAIAKDATVILDNTIFWLGANDQGAGVVWRANGFVPVRVSNHAIEFAMQGYETISDARAYGYQDQGHTFYVLYFPTANKTWVYDAATGLWHERSFTNPASGRETAHRSQCHCFAFNKHLVGDWASGNIYEMNISIFTDFGNPIRRVRRATHISSENEILFHKRLTVDIEPGVAPQPPLLDTEGNPRGPELMLRWSNDAGHTWSNYYTRGFGQAGEYRKRSIWRRLGKARDRVYELSCADPVAFRVIDAYLAVSADNS